MVKRGEWGVASYIGMRVCTADGCDNTQKSDKYCPKHRWRFRHYGDVNKLKWPRHGDEKSPEWNTWVAIKRRCSPTSRNTTNYEHYYLRGIRVCDRWEKSYVLFLKDMGRKPNDKYTIDRIDNSKGYEPSNCRWATKHQQIANRSNRSKTVGVNYDKYDGRWLAILKIEGKYVLRKRCSTEGEAIAARKEAEVLYLPQYYKEVKS